MDAWATRATQCLITAKSVRAMFMSQRTVWSEAIIGKYIISYELVFYANVIFSQLNIVSWQQMPTTETNPITKRSHSARSTDEKDQKGSRNMSTDIDIATFT